MIGVVLGATAIGCSGAADPRAPFALEFLQLPWPSVVVGDTLRDSTGAAAPLRAFVFDGDGRRLTTAVVTFVPLDTGVRQFGTGGLVSTGWRTSPVRLVASVDGLQSRPLPLLVTRRPDTLVAASATAPVVSYALPQVDPTNLSTAVQVRLRSRQVVSGAPPDSTVPGWVVRFAVVQGPTTTRVDSVQLVAEAASISVAGLTARTERDTTDAAGTAGVKLRVFPQVGQTTEDSVVLQATAEAFGRPVPGSPVRLVVRLRPRPAAP
ncbi:MAG: hypothetical protein MUF53_03785 [Gemmatimonadaceae bacterium]|jgi:hypothetical protein|nr:hypothetical protein [Gemmatimonadaceae bacterium]